MWREPTRTEWQLSRITERVRRPVSTEESRGETNKNRVAALAYYRTSSAANVGHDKDSEKRQRQVIEGFAKRGGFEIVAEFYNAAVSGADPIQDRPGFAQLLDRVEGSGVRTVIVEDTSRFARELMAQELGITLLISRGVRKVCHSMARAGSRRPRSPLSPQLIPMGMRFSKVEPADAPMHGGRRLHGPYSGSPLLPKLLKDT